MRMSEIFPDYWALMSENVDDLVRAADHNLQTAKKEKKKSEISQTKANLDKKYKQLTNMNSQAMKSVVKP